MKGNVWHLLVRSASSKNCLKFYILQLNLSVFNSASHKSIVDVLWWAYVRSGLVYGSEHRPGNSFGCIFNKDVLPFFDWSLKALKNLASAGKTVICTIHQPSSEVFAMFDRILLMAEGRTAFLGPIDDCLRFFSCHGMPCPANYNPADFYIFSLATVPGKEIESRSKIKYLCDAYDTSEAAKQVKEIVQKENNHSTGQNIIELENMKKSPYKANWFQQFSAVIWRSFLTVVRDPQILVVKASSSIVSRSRLLSKKHKIAFVSDLFTVYRSSDCAHLPRSINGCQQFFEYPGSSFPVFD